MDKATIVAKLKAHAKKRELTRVIKTDFIAASGVSDHFIFKHFKSWSDYCRAAGVKTGWDTTPISDDEMFAAMRDNFIKLGGITSHNRFGPSYRYGENLIRKRLGGWTRALIAFRGWCEKKAPDFVYLPQLPKASDLPKDRRERRNLWRAPLGSRTHHEEQFGDHLDFRAMRHTPLSELGVVLLFGMVAEDLGFSVEAVRTSFPDCEAKRRIAQGRWRRVLIEFELRSANFKHHGHDASHCDLVVCWEHNWPECPVEVVELRSELRKLKAS